MHDVIVVGAGSSGCAIAARASEDPNRTVLLLEAGPDYSDLSALPFDLDERPQQFLHGPRLEVRAPSHAPAARCAFRAAGSTGGSSAVNTAIALRGMPEDFEEWAGLGLPEWNWRGVLPAYRRLERDLDFGERDYHGDAGPITIRRYPPAEMSAAASCLPRCGARARLSRLPRRQRSGRLGRGAAADEQAGPAARVVRHRLSRPGARAPQPHHPAGDARCSAC